jgi:nucleotidyltransferase substrate binding protein (TIGR01987 family)
MAGGTLADCGTSLPEQDATIGDRGNPRRFHRSAEWKKVMEDFFHGQLGRENLTRALEGFARALAIDALTYPEFVQDVIDSGRIQKFEYCTELFWKYLRACLVAEGLDVANSPRATIKAALDRGFVGEAEYQAALDLVADRNTCSHVYRQTLIPTIVARLPTHCRTMQSVFDRLPR